MPKLKRKLKIRQDIKRKYNYIVKMLDYTYDPISILNELLNRPFIKQRTPEWFQLREGRLTASDLYDAIKNPSSLAKRKVKNVSFNSNAIPALKWGCMLEEIAIRIYSTMNDIKIHQFGLIVNEDIENFGASPDGIASNGIMIEIKCPFSRKIKENEIPEKYYYQMQGQMAVCKIHNCDYVECEFHQYKNKEEYLSDTKENNYTHGIIAENHLNEYKYSSNHQTEEENIKEMEEFKQTHPKLFYWKLIKINIQRVNFDKNKWINEIEPKIKIFADIYKKEIEMNKPLNMFIDDD